MLGGYDWGILLGVAQARGYADIVYLLCYINGKNSTCNSKA